jgi:hypothetical protein
MSASIPVLLPLTVNGTVATTSTVVVRVPVVARVRDVTVAVGTAPAGSALAGTVRKATSSGTVVATFSIAAGATSAVATVSTVDGADEIADGDLLHLVVSAVGSGTAGSNLTAVIELDGSADQDGVDVHSVAVLRGDHPGSVVS